MKELYFLLALIATSCLSAPALSDVVTFDDVPYGDLPYAEKGLTFTAPIGSPVGAGGNGDGRLVAGTNDIPIRITVTGNRPFTLQALDIEGIFRTWTIESSSGGLVSPTGTGQIDFATLTGWSNISSFEIIHDPAEANGFIRVDSIAFTSVPEPTSTQALVLVFYALVLKRKRG